MKKTIDVCDECESPYLAITIGENAYCESCAMKKSHIIKISPYRCERCGQNIESIHTFYIKKDQIGVFCSLQCAMEDIIDKEESK